MTWGKGVCDVWCRKHLWNEMGAPRATSDAKSKRAMFALPPTSSKLGPNWSLACLQPVHWDSQQDALRHLCVDVARPSRPDLWGHLGSSFCPPQFGRVVLGIRGKELHYLPRNGR